VLDHAGAVVTPGETGAIHVAGSLTSTTSPPH